MLNNRHIMAAGISMAACALLVGGLFIYPNYRKAAGIRAQVRELQHKMDDLDGQTNEVERLAREVRDLRMRMDAELKEIPATADMANLMQKLSQPVDYVNVISQNLTTGSAADALIGLDPAVPTRANAASSGGGMKAMPLTVDMEATFESVFALIQSAESVKRLVRVASVRINCKRDEKSPQASSVRATIVLEAIFDPPAAIEAAVAEGGKEP